MTDNNDVNEQADFDDARSTLNDAEQLASFAERMNMTISAAVTLLTFLASQEKTIGPKAQEQKYSADNSTDYKNHQADKEEAKADGYNHGFYKGLFLGGSALLLSAAIILLKKVKL